MPALFISKITVFRLLPVLLSVTVITGCKTIRDYRQPELFHPTLEKAVIDFKKNQTNLKIDDRAQSVRTNGIQIFYPTKLIQRNQGTFTVTVIDLHHASGRCPNSSSIVSLAPAKALKNPGILAGNNKVKTIEIDTSQLGKVENLTVNATSCAGIGLTQQQASQKKLFKQHQFPVVNVIPRPLTTKFNMWSKDDTAEEFGESFAETFYAADVVFFNENDLPVLAYSGSLEAKVRFLLSKEDVINKFGEDALDHPERFSSIKIGKSTPLSEYINFKLFYRPLSFTDILAIFEYQRQGDERQRSIEWLKSLGVALTGASGVFTASTNFSTRVGFLTGIITPELEKLLLWDILLHASNLHERTLREVEEIPPQGEIRRVVFFPKRAIYGILDTLPVYISQIRVDEKGFGRIRGSLITKEAPITSVTAE